jgi:hypothetical protein
VSTTLAFSCKPDPTLVCAVPVALHSLRLKLGSIVFWRYFEDDLSPPSFWLGDACSPAASGVHAVQVSRWCTHVSSLVHPRTTNLFGSKSHAWNRATRAGVITPQT